MRWGAWMFALIVFGAGCDEEAGRFPPGTGTPPPGGSTVVDASPLPDAPTPGVITGRLCLVVDLSDRGGCQPLRDSGLTVREGATSVTVGDDGSFVLDTGSLTSRTTFVTVDPDSLFFGAAAPVTTGSDGSAGGLEIPVIGRADLDEIVMSSLTTQTAGNGVVVIQVDDDGAPVAGAVFQSEAFGGVLTDPWTDVGVRQYENEPTTGERGTAVYFDAPPATDVLATFTVGATQTDVAVASFADSLFLVRIDLTP